MATPKRKTHFLITTLAAMFNSIIRDIYVQILTLAGGGGQSLNDPGHAHTVADGGHDHGASTGAAAPAFTGSAATTATADAFTGTGFATGGQVVTTTDNQTMAENECAGMWLVTATQAPSLITGNTAVSGAPAVLTVMGLAPTTAAEAYKILRAPAPVGSVASHSHSIASDTTGATVDSNTTGASLSGGGGGSGAAVHFDRAEYPPTVSDNATDEPTLVTLTQELLRSYALHVADGIGHVNPDTANVVATDPTSIVDTETANDALNALYTAYEAHRVLESGGVEGEGHIGADSTNAASSASATDLGTGCTRANNLRTKMVAHMAEGPLTPSWRVIDG